MAVDTGGPDAARPFHERAGARFPTLVDAHNEIGAYLNARVVPNGLFVDRDGEILWGKIGGFSVDRAEDVATLDRWLETGTTPPRELQAADGLRAELVTTHMRLAHVLLAQGDQDGAVHELRRVLSLDPDNFIVRKQIWMIRFPERFHPTIDLGWQKEQLERERAEEASECGPDGCRIPGA